ncbi:MAG: YqaE/Pmp3 family membrane protein [Isosphaera sp.]|nr:YqaE/Pmp3 family membrane protein [Isosphaera sp.]
MLPLLATVCPPLAVLAAESPTRAAGNLALTLLLFVPGVVHAHAVVRRRSFRRRYEAVLRALDARAD